MFQQRLTGKLGKSAFQYIKIVYRHASYNATSPASVGMSGGKTNAGVPYFHNSVASKKRPATPMIMANVGVRTPALDTRAN